MLRILVMSVSAGSLWYLFDRHCAIDVRYLTWGETIGLAAAALSFGVAAVVRVPGRQPNRVQSSGFFIR
jgi:hypothetical protein